MRERKKSFQTRGRRHATFSGRYAVSGRSSLSPEHTLTEHRSTGCTSMGWFKRGYSLSVFFFFLFVCFFAMQCWVPVRHFRNIFGHLFAWLVCGSFQWRHVLLFIDYIVWDDKNKVIGFKRSHWIHLGWWSTWSPKLQEFQLSKNSHVTNCRLIPSSAYFL